MKRLFIFYLIILLCSCVNVKTDYYESGKIHYKQYYRNKKKVRTTRFYESGNLESVFKFKSEQKYKYKLWYNSGQLKSKGFVFRIDTFFVADESSDYLLLKIIPMGQNKNWDEKGKLVPDTIDN